MRALAAILVGAALVRLYRLADIPNGFSPDEASYGYNGYSLLQTGRDRFGEALPLFTDNFGDLIATSYMWLTAPAIALFGLGEFAVRLPAALIGTATVYVLYLLGAAVAGRGTGLLAALLLAISPWHVQVSRYAERSPLLALCFCLGLLFLWRWRERGGRDLAWSALCFGLCFYTYAAARVFAPLFVAGVVLLYHRELRAAGRAALGALGILLVLALGAVPHWLSSAGMARAEFLLEFAPLAWLGNYLSYFSPGYLFFDGDPELRHSPRGVGQLHYFELATAPLGAYLLWRRRRREDALIGLWLLLYPIPAALTEPTHAIRSVVGAPLFALLSACGLCQLALWVRPRRVLVIACGLAMAASAVLYSQRYFGDYPEYAAARWHYGMGPAFRYAEAQVHERVYVSNRFFLPHIFALFYSAHPPDQYQQRPLRLAQGKWRYSHFAVGRYRVAPISQIHAEAGACRGALLIALTGEARQLAARSRYELVHTVAVPDGRAAIEIFACR
ncbi:MAG: glycosyltransferase family 39 protein [Candidatus Latescibacteria bacterium]|nr:glycosyltransferase family 39 protein [Candidatus Latescibacterota bacterium]